MVIGKWHLINSSTLILFLFISCSSPVDEHKISVEKKEYAKYKSGDIILRLENGLVSEIFRKIATKQGDFSHAGILINENSVVYVYHTQIDDGSSNGFARKDKLETFLLNATKYAVYRFEGTIDTISVIANLNGYVQRKIPFDVNFDYTDTSTLYCTQMVASAYNNSNSSINKIRPQTKIYGKTGYSIDDIIKNASLVNFEKVYEEK